MYRFFALLACLASAGCLAPLTSRLDETNCHLEQVNQKLDDTNKRLVEVERQLEEANRRLASVDGKMTTANEKLGTFERFLKQLPGFKNK